MARVSVDSLIAAEQLRGEDAEDTALLRESYHEATEFVRQLPWVNSITAAYFGCGVGGVVAVFLFKIDSTTSIDDFLWVVCGDLPTAYLVTDRAHDPLSAIAVYCDLMDEWIDGVRRGDASHAYPVAAEPTRENADALATRVDFLRSQILPALASE